MLGTAARAQAPSIVVNDVTVADWGGEGRDVQEAALAVTRLHRISAYQAAYSATQWAPTRAARGTNQSANWTSSDIGSFTGGDVSVAVADATVGAVKFVVFSMFDRANGDIRYALYQPDAEVPFTPWTVAFDAAEPGPACDKPWVVRRTPQDFFLFWFNGYSNGYSYLRTSDGTNWGSPPCPGSCLERYAVRPTPADAPYAGEFCCQPSVGADGKVYLAHAFDPMGTGGAIRVLVGWDPEGDTAGPLNFEYFLNASGTPLEIPMRSSAILPLQVPAASGEVKSGRVPYLVCDPSNVDRAFIFFHDIAAVGSHDVSVYCARLTRTVGSWAATVEIIRPEAVDPSTGDIADQFAPVAAADSKGWLHVIYYDNRPAPGLSGWGMEFDVRYALSTDHGVTWTHRDLRSDPEARPILDLGLQFSGMPINWGPREYNGIAIYESGGQSHVWATYMGANLDTSPEEDSNHLSRIYASHIVVGP